MVAVGAKSSLDGGLVISWRGTLDLSSESGRRDRRLSDLMVAGRGRLLSRERGLGRDLELLDREPRALIRTTVGRVRGSMKVIFWAT